MCGIAGYYLKNKQHIVNKKIEGLLGPIRQRGPDDEGVCLILRVKNQCAHYVTDHSMPAAASQREHIGNTQKSIEHDLALIHTRYSIIDLSEGGHQPFVSRDRNIIAVFNGEIYNYIELRSELSSMGVQFKTSSDTEVLVEGYSVWGEKLWAKLNGFWAVALYNTRTNELVLSRDRIGVAPLYYRETQEGFYFSSCLESLINIDPKGISLNKDIVYGFIDTGIKDHNLSTYYNEIKSVPSKTSVRLRSDQFKVKEGDFHQYWDFPSQRLGHHELSFQDAVSKYREILFDAVNLRLRADVKVAFELSGGLDSSAIVAAAATLQKNKITTYTAKIKDADEEPYARLMLKKYAVDYRVIEHAQDGFINDYEKFSLLMEEPFDNPNAYTHHKMLQAMKKEGVHVVVTGAGGDEVLAGYEASFWPTAYKELSSHGFNGYLNADWYEFCRRFKTLNRTKETLRHYILDSLKILIKDPKQRNQFPSQETSAMKYQQSYDLLSFHGQALYHFNIALIPFYMRSSDHFTMSVPIEHRFPMLDYRLVEFGLSLPIEYLFHNGWTKYILRKAMEPYLPPGIAWRRAKMGFRFPYQEFFTEHRKIFEGLFTSLGHLDKKMSPYGTYETLLRTNPQLLWRLLSTMMWLKNVKGEI